ncbi:MAG TPA: FHA domain-containing serine/threonine-protein kinase [Trebonia sp.]
MAVDPSAQPSGMPAGLVPGSRIGGYLLEGLVGTGGMATVFRARDERLGRMVALKLLAAGPAADEVVRRRFVREARAVAAVDHPHIIPVYGVGEADGVLFIAMRFVASGDLRVVADREGALPPRRTAAFISPVASALDAAHQAGLVHRDVKPANVLVDAGPGRPEHVYLSDFGLARGLFSAGGLTRAGQFVGTPEYAAPEQISARQVDGRADQYALACVAYTLLTGSVLFEREEPMAVLYAHLSEPPPRVTALRPDLSRTVDRVFATALAKAPKDRYADCGAFADALREALGVAPYDPTRPHRLPDQPTVTAAPPSAGPVMTATAPLTISADPSFPQAAVASPPASPPPARPAPAAWTAVVVADRAHYDRVQAVSDSDAAAISFPAHCPERRFRLSGTEVRIGRRSASRNIKPEIDLTGPPTDHGVSRLHAVLVAAPDGTWSVIDSGSPNGTLVNGKEIPPGVPVPLADGDRIHIGAWTAITISRG